MLIIVVVLIIIVVIVMVVIICEICVNISVCRWSVSPHLAATTRKQRASSRTTCT